jgi:hypothetical protein
MQAPSPKRERGAPLAAAHARSKSQAIISSTRDTQSELDLQARKLCRLFVLRHATARTIAVLAFGGLPG